MIFNQFTPKNSKILFPRCISFYQNATILQKQLRLADVLVNLDDLNITIENEKDENTYRTVFYHKTYVGKIYLIEYPLSVTAVGMYRMAENRILISYTDKDKELLFFSHRGIYRRFGDTD